MQRPGHDVQDEKGKRYSEQSLHKGSSSRRPKTHQRRFIFVEGLGSNTGPTRKTTRSFITRQHYHDLKRQRQERLSSGNHVPLRENLPLKVTTHQPYFNSMPENSFQTTDRSGMQQLTWLGGGRADPFDSYPIPATRDIHELVDHCKHQL